MRTYVRRPRKAFRGSVDHTDRAMTIETQTRGPSLAALIAIGAAALAAGEGPRVCGSVVIARSVWSTELRNALRGLRTYVRI